MDDEEDEVTEATTRQKTTKRRKIKKLKDPNAPKRPISAFLYFSSDSRQAFKEVQHDLTFSEMSKNISELWINLTDAEREEYEEKARKDRARYDSELAKYQSELHEKKRSSCGVIVF